MFDTSDHANVGATITVTDGKDLRSTVTTSDADPAKTGGYLVADLPPGSYSVTVSRDGYAPQTALVIVVAGQQQLQNLILQPSRSAARHDGGEP